MRKPVILIVAFLMTACSLQSIPDPTVTITPSENEVSDETPTAIENISRQLLVWIVPDSIAPGRQGASSTGQVALVDGEGTLTPVLDLPIGTTIVEPCGTNPTSPDGAWFAFYVGGDEGALYLMHHAETPIKIATVGSGTCLGMSTFTYTADSQQIIYLDHEPQSGSPLSAAGVMVIYDLADGVVVFEEPEVAAYDYTGSVAAFVKLFTNSRNQIDEAAITMWDGTAMREVIALTPNSEGCRFTSASLAILSDASLSVVMGHICSNDTTGTHWQLYQVDVENRSYVRLTEQVLGVRYEPYARTNEQIISIDGTALFTLPKVLANTVSLSSVPLEGNVEVNVVVDSQIVMPTTSRTSNPNTLNAIPQFSPDRRWWAFTTIESNESTLNVLDLLNTANAPTQVSAGASGDVISAMQFSQDSSVLYAMTGNHSGSNNSILSINPETGAASRIIRGHYADWMAVSNDQIAVADWQTVENDETPAYLNLITVDVETNAVTTLFEGADIEDGEAVNERFAVPLAWR